jgi:hypothetical protein
VSKITYRITLSCKGVPPHEGAKAAVDIAQEFKSRPWHQNVVCKWEHSALLLQAENDFDETGSALMDEFSDLISACVKESFDGDIQTISVEKLQ